MRSSAARTTDSLDSTIDLSGTPVGTASPVMVTGATGYLGSWVTKGLLDRHPHGIAVHSRRR